MTLAAAAFRDDAISHIWFDLVLIEHVPVFVSVVIHETPWLDRATRLIGDGQPKEVR